MRPAALVLATTGLFTLGCAGFQLPSQQPAAAPAPAQTWNAYTDRVQALQGQRVWTALRELGPPTHVEALGDEAERYVWDWRAGSAESKTPSIGGGVDANGLPVFDCLTTIDVDRNGAVVTVSTTGPRCAGIPPRATVSPAELLIDTDEAPVATQPPETRPKPKLRRKPASSAGGVDEPVRVHRAWNADPSSGGSQR